MPYKKNLKDLTGRVFGRLTVIEFHHANSLGQSYWNCLCECGNYHIASTGNLNQRHVTSCGCTRYNSIRLPKGDAALNRVFSMYKINARHRNLDFNITKDEFKSLTSLNCFYCGKSPSTKHLRGSMNGEYIYNGIDRLDSSKGYIQGNMVSCCEECNRAKMDTSYVDFKLWLQRVSDHMMSKEVLYANWKSA